MGWFSGFAEDLIPLPRLEKARRFIKLMGGAVKVIDAAEEAMSNSDIKLKVSDRESNQDIKLKVSDCESNSDIKLKVSECESRSNFKLKVNPSQI